MPCTRHRVFLAILIVAAKTLNDSSPKNKHWAGWSGLYATDEVNLMERQLLFLLNFEVGVTEADYCACAAPFIQDIAPTPAYIPVPPLVSAAQKQQQAEARATRAAAVTRVTRASKARVQARMPPTPPYEQPVQVHSSLRNITKRISSNILNVTHTTSRAPPSCSQSPNSSLGSSPLQSTYSSSSRASSSATDSEMESLTEDNSSSSSDEGETSDSCADHADKYSSHARAFTLKPTPAPPPSSYWTGRKSSSTLADRGYSECETSPSTPFPPSPRRVSFAPNMPTRPARSVSATYNNGVHHGAGHGGGVTASATMPSIPRIRESISTGFLGRMLGAAKGQQANAGAIDKAPVGFVDVELGHGHAHIQGQMQPSNTFRRLTNSRSTSYRSHGGIYEQVQVMEV